MFQMKSQDTNLIILWLYILYNSTSDNLSQGKIQKNKNHDILRLFLLQLSLMVQKKKNSK